MFSFLKTASPKSKYTLLARFALVVVAGALLAVTAYLSFAWFSENRRTDAGGMQIAAATDRYELLVDRRTVFDNATNYPDVSASGGLKDFLAASDWDLTQTSTSLAPAIAFELENEFQYDGLYNMMPGAYGKLDFYIRPTEGNEDLELDLQLLIGGASRDFDEEDQPIIRNVENATVLQLLKGHILFFEEREGADYEHFRYTGLVHDGRITFRAAEREKCTEPGKTDCYKITLYWEWPITYFYIAESTNGAEETTKKFPAELTDYINAHRSFFFVINQDSNDPEELSDGYDDGDQTIGDRIHYILVSVAEADPS